MLRLIPSALVVFVVLAALTGCTEDVVTRPPGDPSLMLGIGENGFRTVADGEDVDLEMGAQGGYHLWVALRTTGLITSRMRLDLETLPEEAGRPIQNSTRVVTLRRVADPHIYGVEGILTVLSAPECHVDRRVVVRGEVMDIEGVSATHEIVVTARHADLVDDCPP